MNDDGGCSGERDFARELDLDRELEPVITRLVGERPVPGAAFRGDLRRHLLSGRGVRERLSPRRAKALVAAYGGSGLTLLAIAVIGVAGAGPLAA